MTEEVKNLEFMAAYLEGDTLYGAGMGLNILFQYDLKTKEFHRLGVFEGFKVSYAYKICKIFKYKESLYCFSIYSYEVVAYHLDKNVFTYYSPDRGMDKEVSIRCVCRTGNDVWMFQEAAANFITAFSMEQGCYFKYEIDTSEIRSIFLYFDNYIWRCLSGNDVLLAYDVKNIKLKVIKLNESISSYTISSAGERFLILGRDGKQIVVWDPDTSEKIVWETGYEGIEDRPFREIVCEGNQLFLIPCFEDQIFCYEFHADRLHFKGCIDYPREFKRLHNIGSQSMFVGYIRRNENEIYLFPFGGNGMLCLNPDNHETKFFPIQISEDDYVVSNIRSRMLLSDNQVRLECLMDYLILMIKNREKNRIGNNVIGSKCWERINGV